MSRFRRFALWMAGVDRDILAMVPHEQVWYQMLGLTLFFPLILGTFGMTVFLHIIVDADHFIPGFLLGGVLWGLLLVQIDRLLISPRYYADDLVTQPQKGRPSRALTGVLVAALRIMLAVGTALLVSEPVVALVFSTEASSSATAEAQRRLDEENSAQISVIDANRDATIETLEDQIGDLQTQRETLVGELETAQSLYQDAQDKCTNEVDNGNGRRNPGAGPVAEALCQEAATLSLNYQNLSASHSPRIEELNTRIASANEAIATARTEAQDQTEALSTAVDEQRLGIWDRIEFANNEVDQTWRLALTVVLVLLEALVIVAKVVSGSRAYEKLLAYESSRIVTTAHISAAARLAGGMAPAPLTEVLVAPSVGPTVVHAGHDGPVVDPTVVSSQPRPTHRSGPQGQTLEVGGRSFVLFERLGDRSGLGIVHHAKPLAHLAGDERFLQGAAIKQPNRSLDADSVAMAVEALSSEIAVLSALGSLNLRLVPRVMAATWPDEPDHPALAMEYFPRESLDVWLGHRQTNVSAELALSWFDNIVTALGELWETGRVHGDGKPANLLVFGPTGFHVDPTPFPLALRSPGSLVLCDFGATGEIASPVRYVTAGYSPPEYEHRPTLSQWGDIYSFLGCTGRWLLGGSYMEELGRWMVPEAANVPLPLLDLVERWCSTDPVMRVPGTDSAGLVAGLKAQIRHTYEKLVADGQTEILIRRAAE